MANIKSQIKRIRQNERHRIRNKSVRTALKSAAKKVRGAAESGDGANARARLREATSALDRAVSKGVVHKRAAARRKSRLARALNRAASE